MSVRLCVCKRHKHSREHCREGTGEGKIQSIKEFAVNLTLLKHFVSNDIFHLELRVMLCEYVN